jgi:glycosyltransferase involved in cell wall biosynthesis
MSVMNFEPTLDLSLVIPLFNEEESLPELEAWIRQVVEKEGYSYEILLVDDGSRDNSWKVIQELKAKNPNVRGLRFQRNYGKSAALNSGFLHTQGRVVITMDADLQDSPDEIPGLYNMIVSEGFDLVSGWKKKRYDPISKTIPTKLFNAVTRSISGIQLNDFNCGLKAYSHRVVKHIDVYGEMHRYIPVLAKWNGFSKIGERVVQHRARKYGTTKFGLERFLYGFLDLLSITFVSKFRRRPMHFFGTLGSLSFLFGFGTTAYLIAEKVYNLSHGIKGRDVVDNTWFYLALIALVIGVQLFMAGFLGEMMTMHNHRKTDYLISETV